MIDMSDFWTQLERLPIEGNRSVSGIEHVNEVLVISREEFDAMVPSLPLEGDVIQVGGKDVRIVRGNDN
jgi:hypothetical protein